MEKEEKIKKAGELFQEIHQVEVDYYKLWRHETLFHWDWWVGLLLTILPWMVWIMFRKKESTDRQSG